MVKEKLKHICNLLKKKDWFFLSLLMRTIIHLHFYDTFLWKLRFYIPKFAEASFRFMACKLEYVWKSVPHGIYCRILAFLLQQR